MAYTHPQHGVLDREVTKKLRKTLGDRLKARRTKLKKTQKDVAEEVGFDYYTMVSQIESGAVRLPPDRITPYAKALKMPAAMLAGWMMQHYDPITWEALKSGDYLKEKDFKEID